VVSTTVPSSIALRRTLVLVLDRYMTRSLAMFTSPGGRFSSGSSV